MPKPLMVDTDPGFDAMVLPTTEHLRTIARRMDVMTPEKSGWAGDVRDAAQALDALRKAVEQPHLETERLDYLLLTHTFGPRIKMGFESSMSGERCALVIVQDREFRGETLRDALDKARAQR